MHGSDQIDQALEIKVFEVLFWTPNAPIEPL